jgi:hypothetical protein
MKNILKLLTVAVLIAFFSEGCKKNNPVVPPNGYSSVYSSKQVFDSGKVNFVDVCNYLDTGMTGANSGRMIIYCGQGTIFTIPAWAFVTDSLSADSAKKGTYPWHNICFHYKEFYKTSDFILNNITTFTDSINGHKQWIGQSAGVFELTADDGGSPLYLSRVLTADSMKRIKIQVPTNSLYINRVNHPLYIFNANYDSLNNISVTYPNIAWWVPQQDTTMYSSTNPNYLIYNADSLGWTNFMDTTCLNNMNLHPTTTFTIYPPTSSSFADVQIFFVMGNRMVAKAYPIFPGSTQYQIPNVPIGYSGTIVSWCVSTGNILYYYSQTINPIKVNQTLTIDYTQQTTISSVLDSIRTIDALYPN